MTKPTFDHVSRLYAVPTVANLPEDRKVDLYAAVFDLVANPTDWRATINARVMAAAWLFPDKETVDGFVALLKDVVEFYTATKATVEVIESKTPVFDRPTLVFQVHALGYRNGPAGP